jgi:DNA-directed RNA polymerase specialized sigma24 family protein
MVDRRLTPEQRERLAAYWPEAVVTIDVVGRERMGWRFDAIRDEVQSRVALGLCRAAARFSESRAVKPTTYFRCWVRGITKTCIARYREKVRRASQMPPSAAEANAVPADFDGSGAEHPILSFLCPRSREIVWMAAGEGRGIEEISGKFGLSRVRCQRVLGDSLTEIRRRHGVVTNHRFRA